VVFLRSGQQASGPRAAAIASHTYRRLGEANYLAVPSGVRPTAPRGPHPMSDSILTKALILLRASAILILIWQKLIAARTKPTGTLN
jgi:hypothetical protein